MKKAIFIIFLALLVLTATNLSRVHSVKTIVNQNPSPDTPTPTVPQDDKFLDYEFNGITFKVAWFFADPLKLTLIPNYHDKVTSTDVHEKMGCKNLVNAGFYDKEGNPIGMVIADGKLINDYQKNNLFNGIFSVQSGFARISTEVPQNPEIAVQSGPLLINHNQLSQLAINNDEQSRRTVIATTSHGRLLFLIIYKPDNIYLGPLLTDLPTQLQKIEGLLNLSISDALNLDGGSASAFISDGVNLGELTNVGSFFCSK